MICFPQAKINLGLQVLRKRKDGYHDVSSVLMPIPLCDALEVIITPDLPDGAVAMTRSGLPVPGSVDEDLCMKAIKLVHQERKLPGLGVHLHKAIPVGAGLGGGSSDAAHMLRTLDALCDLDLGDDRLRAISAQLGSDCPFFLWNGVQLAEGRGEKLSSVTLDLRGWWLMLVNPGLNVSTAEVYANTAPDPVQADLRAILSDPPATWRGRLINAMEDHVFKAHPSVARIKEKLYQQGAIYAAMSGSGSTVYGLFSNPPSMVSWPVDHRSWVFAL